MPIGVPRIIYCWGEELPAQWTDIYNFIFRRRMVFLMQYLDDELCNQICGLLINIHMEDRSKELEKKEMNSESGLFKGSKTAQKSKSQSQSQSDITGRSSNAKLATSALKSKNSLLKSVDDLLISEDDLAIDQNNMLEQYTLQKITMDWLNWNAQFFDYSDEPYLYYLADILSKDFAKDSGNFMYNNLNSGNSSTIMDSTGQSPHAMASAIAVARTQKMSQLMRSKVFQNYPSAMTAYSNSGSINRTNLTSSNGLDVYSPFRLLANFASQNYDLTQLNTLMSSNSDIQRQFKTFLNYLTQNQNSNPGFTKLLNDLAEQNLSNKLFDNQTMIKSSEKVLGQRNLKREYMQDRLSGLLNPISSNFNNSPISSAINSGDGRQSNQIENLKPFKYLDFDSYNGAKRHNWRDSYRNSKQTQSTIQEEESKKVFVIINSFGGSVGNGITVHDALQFIKAGSLTLGLGVAASAASLVLAGGTIGERYVTEGCHVMIHQPEGGLNGQASDIWIDANEIMKIRLDVAEIYSLSTYRPRHKILRDLDRDFYLTATETIQYGLADEIATNEVMQEIIEMTSKVWDFHDSQQQRLLESRESASAGLDTQTQN